MKTNSITLLTILMIVFCGTANCQQTGLPQPGSLVYHHHNLYDLSTEQKLDKLSLQQILDNENFTVYQQARCEHIASIPLWSLAGASAATSLTFLFVGLHADLTFEQNPDMPTHSAGPYFYAMSGITMGAALIPAIPALVLTLDSKKKLENVAENHNKSNRITFNVKPTPQGIGVFINF
jgi:hypothetical protein